MAAPRRSIGVDDVQENALDLAACRLSDDLEELFVREYANVARIIARIVRDKGVAEDLAVDVFLRKSKALQPDTGLRSAMLYRLAVRAGLDEVRRRSRREGLLQVFSFLRSQPDPEQEYVVHERRRRVDLILARLRPRDSELLVLRAEGLSYTELGDALGINAASVGTTLARAQQAFRKEYLKRYGRPD